jgi:hypothetical protein
MPLQSQRIRTEFLNVKKGIVEKIRDLVILMQQARHAGLFEQNK